MSWPPACDRPGCDRPGVPGRPITVDLGTAGKHTFLVLCEEERRRWDPDWSDLTLEDLLARMPDGRLAALAEEVPA